MADSDMQELRLSLESRHPQRIVLDDSFVDMDSAVEIEGGSATVYFDDGTLAIFSAVWRNDSTAGLYVSFKEAL